MITSKNGPGKAAWLRTLDQIEGLDLPLVGGKAFRLASLKQHGLPVPPGLVLTTAFFEAQLQHAQLIPLWAGSPDVAVTTESLIWLSEVLKTKPLGKELTAALNQALDNLFGPETPTLAVRSSAIDEDQRDHTFAGIHRTELGVPRSALAIAITRCWASALDRPALDYRQAHGMSIQGIRIAVLIQPMLTPACAGVGFTINPLTANTDEFVIEAMWGLGEAVVSGHVQPYFYRLANQPPNYPVLEQREGSPTSPANESAGASPLSQAELAQLALQMEQVHALMGEAQDVEWAKQAGLFYLLQTRPVAGRINPRPKADFEWTRGSYPEFISELPSPLFGSLLERNQNRSLSFFNALGFQVDGLSPMVKLILGRPYLNLTFFKKIISQIGLNASPLLQTIGYSESGGIGSALSADWTTAWRMRGAYWKIVTSVLFGHTRRLQAYQHAVDEAVTLLNHRNFEASPAQMVAQLRQHDRIYYDFFNTNLAITVSLAAVTALSSTLIAPLTERPAPLVSALASKGLKTVDSKLNSALRHLGQLAPRPADFTAAFAELLAQFGDRATYELDLGWPRYQEEPDALLTIIHRYAQSIASSAELTGRAEEMNWSSLIRQSPGLQRWLPWRCVLAAPLVRALRSLLMRRDTLNEIKIKALAACRHWDLALGQQWVSRGWLAKPDDLFWLTFEEIEHALMIEGDAAVGLSSTVQARKDTYQTYAATKMPYRLPESQIPLIQLGIGLTTAAPTDVLFGLPISPGQTRGTILVLGHPDEFKKIAADIILVTPSTDPAWLPLLHLVSGLIVEMGGLLSHGSVIAREYGLPAVANIVNATQLFHTGDSVLVDGSTGIVQILEYAQDSKVSKAGDNNGL